MKLYLSSVAIPDPEGLFELLGKHDHITAASIRTAWDVYPSEKRDDLWPKFADKMFASNGISRTIIDLKDYKNNAKKLQKDLDVYDLIWVHGGNTFYLNYWAHLCNFADVIRELLEKGRVYGGESAGAVLACPNLHGIEFADDPTVAPKIIYEGLGLVDFGIVPHWDNEKFREAILQVQAEAEKFNSKIITIGDSDYVVVDGKTSQVKRADGIIEEC